MSDIVTDAEIAALLAERKTSLRPFWDAVTLKPKLGHKQADVPLTGADGHLFRMYLRQSTQNPFDFSVILAWERLDVSGRFLLCRYNGRQHRHRNPLDGRQRFFDFHIHRATQRYQDAGMDPETFAEPTTRYTTLRGALECLIIDGNVDVPGVNQPSLFDRKEES